jgi:hypothetical protein
MRRKTRGERVGIKDRSRRGRLSDGSGRGWDARRGLKNVANHSRLVIDFRRRRRQDQTRRGCAWEGDPANVQRGNNIPVRVSAALAVVAHNRARRNRRDGLFASRDGLTGQRVDNLRDDRRASTRAESQRFSFVQRGHRGREGKIRRRSRTGDWRLIQDVIHHVLANGQLASGLSVGITLTARAPRLLTYTSCIGSSCVPVRRKV